MYGQRQPIETVDGKIVAGLEEYQACVAAGISPKITPINTPDDLVEYVVRTNIPRHLSVLERACIGVLARERWQGLAHDRKREGARIGGSSRAKLRVGASRSFEGERWFEQAARVLGTTARAIKTLGQIHRHQPDVFEAVRTRKVTMIRDVVDLAKLPGEEDRAEALRRFQITQTRSGQGPRLPMCQHVWDLRREKDQSALLEDDAGTHASNRWVVHEGALEKVGARIEAASIDAMIADIPYGDLSVARGVAMLAARVLRPGAVVVLINGVEAQNLPVLNVVAEHLSYVAIGAVHLKNTAPQNRLQGRLPRMVAGGSIVHVDVRPVFFFARGEKLARPISHLHYSSEQREKTLHTWQKDLESTLDILKAIVEPGSRVLDPVCGSGTTGEAALRHGCAFVGIDIDPKAVRISRARLAQVEKHVTGAKLGVKRAG